MCLRFHSSGLPNPAKSRCRNPGCASGALVASPLRTRPPAAICGCPGPPTCAARSGTPSSPRRPRWRTPSPGGARIRPAPRRRPSRAAGASSPSDRRQPQGKRCTHATARAPAATARTATTSHRRGSSALGTERPSSAAGNRPADTLDFAAGPDRAVSGRLPFLLWRPAANRTSDPGSAPGRLLGHPVIYSSSSPSSNAVRR